MILLAQAPGEGWGQIAFMVLAAAVLLMQLINNVITNRSNKEIIDKFDTNHTILESKFSGLHDNLLVLTTNIGHLVDCFKEVEKMVDKRDDEGRRRIYTPSNHEAIQNKHLEAMQNLIASQHEIASQLKELKSGADIQAQKCNQHMFKTSSLEAEVAKNAS